MHFGPSSSRQRHTTEAIRRAIQRSEDSLRTLAKRHGINPKTIAKWKKRSFVADLPIGPKQPSSTVLSIEEDAIVVAFRRHTLLPLDGCLYALQPTIPHLTRSSLHRCLRRHGISRLSHVENESAEKRKFKGPSDRVFAYRRTGTSHFADVQPRLGLSANGPGCVKRSARSDSRFPFRRVSVD